VFDGCVGLEEVQLEVPEVAKESLYFSAINVALSGEQN
jgi:hypothetical protein